MISADSVKNRLYNKAKATGKTMQELLIMYCLERTRGSPSDMCKDFQPCGTLLLRSCPQANGT